MPSLGQIEYLAVAKRVKQPPPMDGDWDRLPWARCKEAGGDFILTSSNVPDPIRTTFRACYDQHALYVGVDCEEPDLGTLPAGQRGWDPESAAHAIGLCLGPRHDHQTCVEFLANPFGGTFHYERGPDGSETTQQPWYSGWEAHVERHDRRWRAVFRIPFGKYQPRPGTLWTLQFSRHRDSHYNSSTWTPTSSWYASGYWFTAEHGHLLFGPARTSDLPACCRRDPSVRKRSRTFSISATADPYDDFLPAPWSEKTLKSFVDRVCTWGVDRLYWIDYGPQREGFWDYPMLPYWGSAHENCLKIFENFGGDILPAVVDEAHARGIELWTIFKPLDLCFDYTVPEDTPLGAEIGRADRVGGRLHWITHTMASRPELSMQRIPVDVPYRPVETTVRTVLLVKEDAEPSCVNADSIEIWVSEHNHHYRRYDEPLQRSETIEDRPVRLYDPRGVRCSAERRRVRVIRLEGLGIRERYLTVVCPQSDRAQAGTFRNRAFALVEVYDADGRLLPFLYGSGPNPNVLDVAEQEIDWRQHGFQFAGLPNLEQRWGFESHLALDNARGLLSIALGKDEVLVGGVEPAEPLARRHLLEWVARSIEQGVDGFEIRIRHHMGCPEWEAFGFGPGPRSEYLKQTGMDLLQGGIDYAALQRIRGEGWLEFARQAGQRLRAAGKRLSHELIWYMGLTPEERCRFGFRIPWERMIREGLVDELSFKGVSPFTRVGRSMLRLAHEHEIPVRMELHQEPLRKCAAYRAGIPQMIDECRKMGFAGLNIYETASYLRAKPDGTFGEGLPGSIEFWRQMSERFRRS